MYKRQLHDSSRQFASEGAATAWRTAVARPRVQMVIKVPERKRWTVAGKEGLLVEVQAYRVVVPCTGVVVLASPTAGNALPDKKACTAVTKAQPAPRPPAASPAAASPPP